MSKRITLDLGFADFVAEESNADPKEIYIGLKSKEGQWLQDLAIVGQQYHIEEVLGTSEIIPDQNVRVCVYADAHGEDYTDEFGVDVWSPECTVTNIRWNKEGSTTTAELPSEVVIPECELHPWIFSASKSNPNASDLTRMAIEMYLENAHKCQVCGFDYET